MNLTNSIISPVSDDSAGFGILLALITHQRPIRDRTTASDIRSWTGSPYQKAFRHCRSTSMLCFACATSPLRWKSVSRGCSLSAVSTSRRPHSTRGRRSICTASNPLNPTGTSNKFHPTRYFYPGSFEAAPIPKGGFAVRGELVYHRRGGPASKTTLREDNRPQPLSHIGISFRKPDMRDEPRERIGDMLKRAPSSAKRSTKASDDARVERRERQPWQIQKSALSEKFGSSGWSPRKRISPDSLEGIRGLHAQYPDTYTTPVLAEQFKVSPEAIRRILKSKWRPNDEEEDDRRERWNKRGVNIWGQMNELGIKPPRKWRDQGVGKFERGHPAMIGQFGPSTKATHKVWSDTNGSTESHPDIPAVKHEVGQVPLADRIL